MKKMKKHAVICCVISLIFSFALGTTGWFLVGSYQSQTPNDILAFLFRFFFIVTPVAVTFTLIAIARMKE